MTTYLVIGVCIFLLIAVIYISAKPISMGIEARRNINDKNDQGVIDEDINKSESEDLELNNNSLSDEIVKLKKLKDEGLIDEYEFEKAKEIVRLQTLFFCYNLGTSSSFSEISSLFLLVGRQSLDVEDNKKIFQHFSSTKTGIAFIWIIFHIFTSFICQLL